MNSWVIDCYALLAAHCRSVLGLLQERDRLHVSPLTWFPGKAAGTHGSYTSTIPGTSANQVAGRLTLVGGAVSRPARTATGLTTQLHELHARGVIVVAADHECDPQLVAGVEGSWGAAGLIRRPTDETYCAVMTAERLSLNLVTEDSDARKLARHHHVHPISVDELASALAA